MPTSWSETDVTHLEWRTQAMKNYGVTIIIPFKDLTGGNKQIITSTYYSLYNSPLS